MTRPRLRLVLAVSLDGRLAPPTGGAAQLGGAGDRWVLEEALAWADGALLGAGTLRSHGCTCLIHHEPLRQARRRQGLGEQPIAIVASTAGVLDPAMPFFRQPLERWLLRAEAGPATAQGFARVLPLSSWPTALQLLADSGVKRLAVLGGAVLATALLNQGLIDELQLTLAPLLLGGPHHWSEAMPAAAVGRDWQLLEARPLEGHELVLRYGRASSA